MTQPDYSQGGWIGVKDGKLAPVLLSADECLMRPAYLPALLCLRADHPTPTSDCTKHVNGIRHITEETA